MTPFLALATLLIVVAAVSLAVPLLRRPRTAALATDRSAANLAIFGDQLAELERERAEGSLSAADFEQARTELQRRLLEEVKPEAQAGKEAAPSRKTALAVVVLLPLCALLGYGLLGTPAALDPANTRPQEPQHQVTAAQIEGMVERLAQRLQQNPDDAKGWVMLARSYKMLGRYAESAAAYAKAPALVDNDPLLLADYAEVLAISGNAFKGRPSELIDRALKLAPEDPQIRLLAGAAAGERHDYQSAIAHWEKAIAQLEPGSEEALTLQSAIERARAAQQRGNGGSR
ncbi:c-type cytochrome biogenesis protein CcmI [Azospira restricta]|uniref:C-type cytochrome biogenesis protein CcmI n=1 Tax=Azospira restricta TaxID=404405 RepID=A0A974SQS9_9RHOO|nr:c-type cytochrome biogenesis protein CcmI [Azospira restricta]QRJ64704.1 c-type cytochrome biogenesis protein CcmI [Azospira restricta]